MSKKNEPVIMNGRKLADEIQGRLTLATTDLRAKGIVPGLATVLVGDDEPSAMYIAMKHRTCGEIGIRSMHTHIKEPSQTALMDTIQKLNADPEVDAILVQIPLPKGMDEEAALLAIEPDKDADGLNPINLGRLVIGTPGPLPCTPNGIHALLVHYGVPVEGKHVVIIGRGLTIGRPLALLLSMKRPHCNAAVTVLHTGVPDMPEYMREADIIISAAGTPGIIRKDMVKPGVAIVAAGISRQGKKLLSDAHEDVKDVAGWITPRVGGVGPMTVAMLMQNTVQAAQRRAEGSR